MIVTRGLGGTTIVTAGLGDFVTFDAGAEWLSPLEFWRSNPANTRPEADLVANLARHAASRKKRYDFKRGGGL